MYIFFLRTLSEIYMKNSFDCIWTLNKKYHKYSFQLFLGLCVIHIQHAAIGISNKNQALNALMQWAHLRC